MQVDAEQFDSAIELFQKVIEADSTSPKGYFFIAAAYSNLVSDYRNFGYKSVFYEHVDKAIEIGELREKSGNATVEDLFYYGGAVGYRGIFRSFDGDWWGAFTDGLKGRGLLAKAYKADSSYMDVYLGLGTYDYWRSAKTKVLWWLPFFSDKRDQGIEEIKKAMGNGKFSTHEGKYALMRIYFDYDKYEEAIRQWEEVEKLNPEDPFSHYWLGRSYIMTEQYENALLSFETILAVYLRSPYYDPGGEMECRYFMGLCQSKLGNLPGALEQLRLAATMAEQLSGRKDLEEILEKIEPLLENVEDEIK
ncbi:MAG: tetratricopeptide repeat protein [candidate division Zixibacteria bacterium]